MRSDVERQLARFGQISQAAVPAVVALLEKGYDLVGATYGGADIPPGENPPDWFRFMMDVARCRYGSAFAGSEPPRVFGLGQSSIEARLAPLGLSLEELTKPVKAPDVEGKINTQPWLWGYSEDRRRRLLSQRQQVEALTSQAHGRHLGGTSNQLLDAVEIESRFATVAGEFGFRVIEAAFNFSTLLYRPTDTGMGIYLGVKVHADRRIPYPASISLEVMPDVDYIGLDSWFAPSYESGWLFKSLSLLGVGGTYTTGYDGATFELCVGAQETFLQAVLPTIVSVSDRGTEA
jgi:hypothetical protein